MSGELAELRGEAWVRLLAKARKSLESSGGALDRSIGLPAPADSERRLVIGITGQYRPETARRLTVGLTDLDAALRRQYGTGLRETLEALGGPLRDRPVERAREARERETLIAAAAGSVLAAEPWYQAWLSALRADGSLTRLVRRDNQLTLEAAIRILEFLHARDPGDPVPLPVLAERFTGDTKALLAGGPLATLVLRALAARSGVDSVPRDRAGQRALWETSGAIADDLASQVLVLNVPCDGDGMVSGWLNGAARSGMPFRLTLQQATRVGAPVVADIYVCENPAVLRVAAAELGAASAALVCTEGVPSAACHAMLGKAVSRGARLHWRADFDWVGLRLVAAAIAKYGARPWRMTARDYRDALAAGETTALIGPKAASPWDPRLAPLMAERGRAVMEERLIATLVDDLKSLSPVAQNSENGLVRVAILGPFEVRSDVGGCLPVVGARLRDLVIRLALAGGKPVSTSALAEAIWGDDPPADLANALQTLVSRARRALGGAGAVEQSAAGYRLAVTPDDVDALRFERLVADGAVEEALALWRGPALEDAGEFAAPYALRLYELKLDATLTWLAGEITEGRAAAHVAGLEALAAESPLNEKVATLLMRALAATGRRAEALAVYQALRGRLADELGIDPGPDLRAVHLEVLRGEAKAIPGPGGNGHPGRVRTNLRAQLTSFVGREDDVARVGRALDAHRLVTLVGPGGAGKTRLASEVAAHIAAEVAGGHQGGAADGVWMAELASVTDAADVPQAVLGSIGLRESRLMPDGSNRITTRDARTRLLEGLADARALLVLDNCEHLIDACAHLADALLAHSPRLRIVATSREPLGITGESLLVVPPLAEDPAVRLFADRARAVRPGFNVDEENLPLVVDIVRRLDGLPLAIELAAARLRTLPLTEISRRLNDRFRLLTGGSRTALPRHRTLRAVVEWSWELLSPAERLLAERFSVFPAGATPDAVAEICGDLGDVDEFLSSLVDKSLLQPVGEGTRLRMLETIREYGAEKLAERAEIGEVRRRHAVYYCDLMIEAGPKLLTRDQLTWLRVVQDDHDNILAALRYWCDAEDASRAIALAVWVSCLAILLGNHADITEWITQAAVVPGEADPGLRTVAEALYVITQTMRTDDQAGLGGQHDFPGLEDRIDALDFEAFPLAGLLRPVYAMFTQDTERAHRYIAEALAGRDEWLVAATWMASAALAENCGDMDTVRTASAEALHRFRALGERWGLSSALRIVGGVRIIDGDLDGAAAAFTEAGRVLYEMGSRDDESQMRLRIADIAARRGDLDTASELYEAALVAAESDGSPADVAIVSAGSAMFAVMVGNVELARSRNATAQQRLELLSLGHPVREHMAAIVKASGLVIALADGDLPLAREHAASAYQAAMAAEDMPLLAMIAGALAYLAHALGESGRAAEMLGACVPVRGGEDATDLMMTRLGSWLRTALGAEDYARAYDRGKALGRAEAIALLDPAGLVPWDAGLGSPDVPAQRQREEHDQQADAPGERPADLRADRPA